MKVADTLLKERQIEGKTNVNRPRTETPPTESQQRISGNIPTNNGTGTQGGGVI
jgi:hypothetical protein